MLPVLSCDNLVKSQVMNVANKPLPYHSTDNVIPINRLFTPFHALKRAQNWTNVPKTRRFLTQHGVTALNYVANATFHVVYKHFVRQIVF